MFLSLYIIPGDVENEYERAIRSFNRTLLNNVVVCNSRTPRFNEAQAPYFAYLYSDEWLSPELSGALSVFFQARYWDSLSLFRHILSENKDFIAPRIFRSTTPMTGLMPTYPRFLMYERVLNGCILRK